MKILHVDDSLSGRAVMRSYLSQMGHEVISADSGEKALEFYAKEEPDLILLDVIMPNMDGYEVARHVRSMQEDEDDWIPIVFLSSMIRPLDIVAGIEAGGDDYLAKPVEFEVLGAKMKAMARIAHMRGRLLQVSRELERANEELQHLVDIDGLTKVANRHYLNRFLIQATANAIRYHHPLSIVMADVDYFKAYNDNYGHIIGDDCLINVARTLQKQSKRNTDLVARYGGEEFCVVLPDTSLSSALLLAEKMRAAVETLNIPHAAGKAGARVTLSLGVASASPMPGFRVETLLNQADKALYQAKQKGRNQVQNFTAPTASPATVQQKTGR